MALDKQQLRKLAANITNKTSEFNLREGMLPAADTLPGRFFKEPLTDSGKVLPEKDFNRMLNDYYRLRGWDS